MRSAHQQNLPATTDQDLDLPTALRREFPATCDAPAPTGLRAAVERLSTTYRSGRYPARAVLATPLDATAYALYRMAATTAAASAAFTHTSRVARTFRPRSHLDLGGGTGAAAWAATRVWPSLTDIRVLDRAGPALALGQRLAAHTRPHHALRRASWEPWRFHPGAGIPVADLVTISYLLSELAEPDRDHVVRGAAGRATVVVVVEPGTPAGHARILRARTALMAAGMSILAPCPHQTTCPVSDGTDWCHFATRVARSPLHRRLKAATLSYEDEKFSFIAATRDPVGQPPGRLVRRPRYRKGLVTLTVCQPAGELEVHQVSKKQGDTYKQARDARWGDPWPTP